METFKSVNVNVDGGSNLFTDSSWRDFLFKKLFKGLKMDQIIIYRSNYNRVARLIFIIVHPSGEIFICISLMVSHLIYEKTSIKSGLGPDQK